MDPFVSTITKQGMVLGAVAFLLVAGAYILLQYSRLQYAMSLNMTPPPLQ
jgi:hypothetical protein